jgi:hypothetical protein
MTLTKIILLLLTFNCIITIKSLIIPYLQNPIGTNHQLINVNKKLAFKYLKQKHIESIKDDLPLDFCEEISQAKEMCRNLSDFKLISIIKPTKSNKDLDYIIFYRRTTHIPSIFTIEGIFRIPYSTSLISYSDILTILKQTTDNNGVYLQTNELKLNNIRFNQNILIEKSFNLSKDFNKSSYLY